MPKNTKICFVFSTNLFHGELSKDRFARFVKGGHLVRCLNALSQIPCSISIEGVDMELYPELAAFAQNPGKAEVIGGEYAHAFPNWLHTNDRKLANLNVGIGNGSDHPVRFIAEYNTYPQPLAQKIADSAKEMPAVYAVDTNTAIYSDNQSDGIVPALAQRFVELNGVHAIKNGGVLYLRTYSKYMTPIINEGWFGFQRWREGNAEAKKTPHNIVASIENQLKIAEADGVPVIFITIDVESCVIGSHHGAAIYEEAVSALVQSGLPLIGPREAYEVLKAVAIETERPHRVLDRNKWLGHDNQLTMYNTLQEVVSRLCDIKPYTGRSAELDRKLELIAGGSDGFVVYKYRIDDKIKLSADHGELLFGGENFDSLMIQNAIMQYFLKQEPLMPQLQKLAEKSGSNSLAELFLAWAERMGV